MTNEPYLSLRTKNCIVTGEPATVFSGHVRLRVAGPIQSNFAMPILVLGVTTGFKDKSTLDAATADERGCHGNWKMEYGLTADSHGWPGDNVEITFEYSK